jgi:5'-3' exonuclease
MGIHGLTKLYNKVEKQQSLLNLQGKHILIDAIYLLYKQGIGQSVNTNKSSHLLLLFNFTTNLLSKGIIPIFVFDGDIPNEKNDTIIKRRLIKEKANEKCNIIVNKTTSEYYTNLKKSFHMSYKDIEKSKQFLVYLGVPVIQAPSEADSQLAALSNAYCNEIIGIITQDSDVLLYGGSNLITNFCLKQNTISVINRLQILQNLLEDANTIRTKHNLSLFTNFTHENFLDYSILLESDYSVNNSIQLLNTTNKEKINLFFQWFVINNLNIQNTIQYIINLNNSDYIVPDNYFNTWKQTKEIYLNATIINPFDIPTDSLNLKIPDITNIKKMLDIHTLDKDITYKLNILSNTHLVLQNMNNDKYNNLPTFRSYKYKLYLKKLNTYLNVM